MNKEETRARIKELGKWYQNILINGVYTKGVPSDTLKIWRKIRACLPEKLNGLRILDLGSNAGHYSCLLALEGAEVTGINHANEYKAQAEFVREYFEEKHGKLNIKNIWKDIREIDFDELGEFDYVLASAVIHHIGIHKYKKYTPEIVAYQKKVVKRINTKNFIIRTKNIPDNCVDWATEFFNDIGYGCLIKDQDNKRGLGLYARNKKRLEVNHNAINEFILHKLGKTVVKHTVHGRLQKIYCAECSDGTKYRYEKYKPKAEKYKQAALAKGCKIAETLYIFPNAKVKISEWIEGILVKEVWDKTAPFLEMGAVIGKINTVTIREKALSPLDKDVYGHIAISDINETNFVYTKRGELYLIDWNVRLVNESELDSIVTGSLIKRIGNIHKIRFFLSGYEKYRDTKNIKKLVEKYYEHS